MVRLAGLEPVTPTMSRWCSNQLSYSRIVGGIVVKKRGLFKGLIRFLLRLLIFNPNLSVFEQIG